MEKAILCVDDEKAILSGLEQQLRREFSDEFLLEFAQSGEEALSVLEELQENNIQVQLVITDQMMPGMKGNELIEKVSSILPKTKCIMITGYADSEDLKNLNKENLLKCFHKPWDGTELIKFVKSTLTYSKN